MGIRVDYMPDIPVIILEAFDPVQLPDDPALIVESLSQYRRTHGGHMYRIFDISHINLLSSEMLIAIAAETGYPGGADDPNVTTLFVVQDRAFDPAQYNYPLTQETYAFETQDDALDFLYSIIDPYD